MVFFIDRSIGRHQVANALRAAGARAEAHDDHFPQDCTDAHWLVEVGRRGWFVLTKDNNIRKRALEFQAVQQARIGLFALKDGNMSGPLMAVAFVSAIPAMSVLAQTTPRPFIARVTKHGKVVLLSNF